MTVPYNITLEGIKDQLIENYPTYWENRKLTYYVRTDLTKNKKIVCLRPSQISKFTSIVYNTIRVKIPSLNDLTKYLNNMIKVLLKLNQPVIWITPAGLKITLSTIKYESIRTKTKLIKNSKPVTISLPTTKLDTVKIRRSFMPNLIHSLDASNIHLLIEKMNGDPLYTIHDCFASTANNISNIEKSVKETFIEIYFQDGNYLERMHLSLQEQIKSYTCIYTEKRNGEIYEYILVDKKEVEIPQLPQSFIDPVLILLIC